MCEEKYKEMVEQVKEMFCKEDSELTLNQISSYEFKK